MNNFQSGNKKRLSYKQVFALFFIICGALSSAICLFDADGFMSQSFHAFGFVESPNPHDSVNEFPNERSRTVGSSDAELLAAEQPKTNEWPYAAIYQHFTSRGISDRYSVTLTPLRGTQLLRLDIFGRSADDTEALATWLTSTFARDLQQSYQERGMIPQRYSDPPPIEIIKPEHPVPIYRHFFALFSALTSSLLLLWSGFLLFQASRPGRSGV